MVNGGGGGEGAEAETPVVGGALSGVNPCTGTGGPSPGWSEDQCGGGGASAGDESLEALEGSLNLRASWSPPAGCGISEARFLVH